MPSPPAVNIVGGLEQICRSVSDLLRACRLMRSFDGRCGPLATYRAGVLIVNSDGGVLTSPQIVATFFNNDPDATTCASFYMGPCASSYWEVESEYGVGPSTAQIVDLDEAAPTSVDDGSMDSSGYTPFQEWLLAEIQSGTLPAVTTPINDIYHAISYTPGGCMTRGGTAVSTNRPRHSALPPLSGT